VSEPITLEAYTHFVADLVRALGAGVQLSAHGSSAEVSFSRAYGSGGGGQTFTVVQEAVSTRKPYSPYGVVRPGGQGSRSFLGGYTRLSASFTVTSPPRYPRRVTALYPGTISDDTKSLLRLDMMPF
jgi:hypothetical protein